MIHGKDFVESIGAPDEGFTGAMDRALLRIREEERSIVVKRKLSLTLAAAIVAVLALTGAALAVGMNLFEFFGKHDERLNQLAPEAQLETVKPESVESDALGTARVSFNNGYYDGQSLIVGFTRENCERYAAFEPTPELLERMERVDERYFGVSYDEKVPGAEAVEDFLRSMYEGEPCGYVMHSVYPSDHCTTGEGTDLPPWGEYLETLEDGSVLHLREFESPLPEEAQNRESLELHIRLWQMNSYFYFDGKDCYKLYEKAQPAGEITAVVRRTDAITRTFAAEAEYGGVPVEVEAQVSAVRASVKTSADGTAFPEPGEHSWYDALLLDENGRVLRTTEVDFDADAACISFTGTGALPERLTLYIGVDQEGEFDSEDFKADAVKIELGDSKASLGGD